LIASDGAAESHHDVYWAEAYKGLAFVGEGHEMLQNVVSLPQLVLAHQQGFFESVFFFGGGIQISLFK